MWVKTGKVSGEHNLSGQHPETDTLAEPCPSAAPSVAYSRLIHAIDYTT
jgi:hypothetical protein